MDLIIVNPLKKKENQQMLKHFALGLQILKKNRLRNRAKLKKCQELTIVFLSESQMRRINKQFRKKDKSTDVLSFAPTESKSLGELLLCLPVLKRQARQMKHSLQSEMDYMFIHGVLHLLGYDHERSKPEEKLMFRLQNQVFAQLNKELCQ